MTRKLILPFVWLCLALAAGAMLQSLAAGGGDVMWAAVLAVTHPTLLDFKSRLDADGKVDTTIIEMLAQTNEVYPDMVMIEGTDLTGTTTTVRTGIPEPTWRKMYGGVQPTKSTTAKVREGCGMLEDYSEIDKAMADLNGNSAAWRLSEDFAKIEGFGQKVARYVFYGNEGTEPEAFTGLSPRFNDTAAMNGENVIKHSAAAGSVCSSIWLCVWGQTTGHGFYPKGSMAGLRSTDKGQVTIENVDGAGGRMEAYRTHYRQDIGLTVRDWRYFVRMQMRLQDVVKNGATGPVLGDMMARALRRVPPGGLGRGRAAFYMNRDTMDAFDLQSNNFPLLRFSTQEEAQGKFVTMFRGVPVRRVDQLLNTETAVTGTANYTTT